MPDCDSGRRKGILPGPASEIRDKAFRFGPARRIQPAFHFSYCEERADCYVLFATTEIKRKSAESCHARARAQARLAAHSKPPSLVLRQSTHTRLVRVVRDVAFGVWIKAEQGEPARHNWSTPCRSLQDAAAAAGCHFHAEKFIT